METVQAESKTRNFLISAIVVLILAILVLIFFISPLKELVFPSSAEPALTLSVVESIGPDAATGLYRIVVEAKTEGKPEPQVTFNRNDGVGQVGANSALLLLEGGETFLLKGLATNPHGTAEAELELFAGIMVGAVQGDRSGTAAPGEGGEDEDVPADPGEAEPERAEPPPPDERSGPGNGGSDAPAHQITSVLYRYDRSVDGELDSDWVDITSLVNRGGDEAVTLHDDSMFHVFSLTTFDIDDENLWDYISIDFADGNIYHRGVSRTDNSISFVWQIRELLAEGRGDFHSSATITLRYPPGTEDIKTIRVFSPAPEPRVEPEERRYSSFAITPDASNSGFVASDGQIMTGVILLGDSDDNRQYKGYLSFPARWLGPAVSNMRLESVDLVFNSINISGNPQGMASLVDFKWFEYGDTLDPGDFAVGGTRLFTIDSSQFNTADGSPFVISDSRLLVEGFAYALGTGSNVQIKMGLNRATNRNNSADIFQLHTGTVRLVVRFSYIPD